MLSLFWRKFGKDYLMIRPLVIPMVDPSLNQSETTAFEWLKSEKDYSEEDIGRESHKQTPDFICDDYAYEVKRPRGGTLVVHERQVSQIEEHDTKIVVADHQQVRDIFDWGDRESVDWSIKIQESKGKTVWFSGDVLEFIEENKFEDETPNQFLKRKLVNEEGKGVPRQFDEEDIREFAREEARDLIEKAKQGYL